MKNILLLICTFLFYIISFGQSYLKFEKNVFNYGNEKLLYRQLSPNTLKNSPKTKKYPLVIFFHGAGERGNDNEKQLIHGAKLFSKKENFNKFPCYFIAPQCPEKMQWVDVSWTLPKHNMPPEPSVNMFLTLRLMDQMITKYPIDTARIYVIGLSMGGFAVWDIISRYPDKIAAAVPICGGGDEACALRIKEIPIWAFHGGKDKLVMTSRSRNMIAAIKNVGGNPKYTEYPKLGHLCWNAAFAEPELLNWIFSQTKE